MKLSKIILLISTIVFGQNLWAQSATNYIIQLGDSDANLEAHIQLSDIANVYFESTSNLSTQKLKLGSFTDLQKAEAITQNLKSNNFPNAYVEPLALEKGLDVYVVQLANFDSHEQIDWDRYQLNKKVYTTIESGKFKIVTGIFPDYASALPLHDQLFQVGFINSEVVKINSVYLHEVSQEDITFQRLLHNRSGSNLQEFTAKGGIAVSEAMRSNTIEEVAPPIVGRVALSKSIAPAINEDLARISVKNLQSILSVYGNYTEEPNGLYDAQTANAYYATVQLTPSLKDFSRKVEEKVHVTSGYFTDWSDVELLLNIAEDITGNAIDFSDQELKALISLYTKPKALDKIDAQKVKDWKINNSAQLQNWKSTGRLNSDTLMAYMLVSVKVEVLLEDYFLAKGFMIDEASNLAKASMFAMLVGNFADKK